MLASASYCISDNDLKSQIVFNHSMEMCSGQLRIPSHVSVLHVEQEVVGDDTPALESVLQCDVLRCQLQEKEKQLTALLNT